MAIAFFPESLIFNIPKGIFLIGLIGILVAGIVEYRQGHIGRPAIFINSLLLWQIFYSTWAMLPAFFQWYLNVGSVVGVVALIAYIPITRFKLPKEFYTFSYFLYGSLSIIAVVIGAIYFKIPLI